MDTFIPNSYNTNQEFNYRYLEENDYYKGYFDLLSQLTEAPKPEYQDYLKRFELLKKANNPLIIIVEHKSSKKIVGTITSLFEYKFIRNLGTICHIEDFVVDKDYRGMKIGTVLLNMVKEISVINKCYKILLECDDDLVEFYTKQGYKRKSNGMALYFK